jgi:AP2-associated kinase
LHENIPKSISHRDIKIENILLQNKKFKLCDFGSASVKTLEFNTLMPTHEVEALYEEFEKYTTLMYRPPEMIDRYKKFPVTNSADIWVNFLNLNINYRCLVV